MKRARLFLLVLAVMSAFVFSACTAKRTSKKDNEDNTTKSSESGDKGNSTNESADTNETTPGTDESTPGTNETIKATAKGSCFTDYKGKTVDEIVENIQRIRTVTKDDTMENYGERFDYTPDAFEIEKEFSHNASYHWHESDQFVSDYAPLISIHCKTGDDDKLQVDMGSSASIMIYMNDKETLQGVYDKVCALLQESYGEVKDDGTFEPWNPIDSRNADNWYTTYGARHISLDWPGGERDCYVLQIMIDLRTATE